MQGNPFSPFFILAMKALSSSFEDIREGGFMVGQGRMGGVVRGV